MPVEPALPGDDGDDDAQVLDVGEEDVSVETGAAGCCLLLRLMRATRGARSSRESWWRSC